MTSARVGVIGVGHLGFHHARNYAAIAEADLVGVVDADVARCREVAQQFCPEGACASIAELIDRGIDAASVVVPTTHHFEVAMQLIEAGVDVLVEKPLAATIDEAQAMVDAARERARVLQVGHIERFNGAVAALFGAVRRPQFIEVHRLSPYPMRGDDVSVVLDLMIHDLEIIRALVGSPIVGVDAVGVPVFSATEDIANARLRFENGCVANITASRVSMDKMRKIRIFEPDAYMSTDYGEQEVRVYRKRPGAVDTGASPMEHILIDSLPVERGEPLRRELTDFLRCVRERARPLVDGEDATEALRLAQEIINSIRR